MDLIKSSNGIIFSFGFDMNTREPSPDMICWSDFDGKTWDARGDNVAGFMTMDERADDFQFIREFGNRILAYKPGLMLEIVFVGQPLVYEFHKLKAR